MKALLSNYVDLSSYIQSVNNGRTDNVTFYQSGNIVTVKHVYFEMSEEHQARSLKWFLDGFEFLLIPDNYSEEYDCERKAFEDLAAFNERFEY